MKNCSKCGIVKNRSDFHKSSCNLDGLRGFCKDCLNFQNRKWKEENKNKHAEINKNHYLKTKEKRKVQAAKWWREHSHIHAAKQARRRFSKLNATPKWLSSGQLAHISAYYESAKILSAEWGMQMDVDHIIPLRGKSVCGLHVPWNLQVMEHKSNSQKSNLHEN